MIYVTYYSETGNTEKVASAIFDTLDEEKEIVKIENLGYDKLEESELTFIGFPVQAGGLPKKVRDFFKGICPIRGKIALFCTHASPREMGLVSSALKAAKKYLKDEDIEVVDDFDCLGEVKVEQLLKMPMIRDTEKYWRGHPDDKDEEKAKKWARGLVE